MAHQTRRSNPAGLLWALAEAQHGVVTRGQLLEIGFTADAVKHRVRKGRLHRKARGVYAIGRPELSRYGLMMVAVLACGPDAVVSHRTGAELWALRRLVAGPIEVSVARSSPVQRPGMTVHRREILVPESVTSRHGVPVTTVPLTLIDVACSLSRRHLEAAVNMADSLDLLDPDRLRSLLGGFPGVPGVGRLRNLLEEQSFCLTDSELERMFLPLAGAVGLPVPRTQRYVSSWRVDFVWPDLGLVVETDSLRYHRTALQQRRDAARDHAHLLKGLESVRFTHFQVAYEKAHVRRTLREAARKAAALGHARKSIDGFGVP